MTVIQLNDVIVKIYGSNIMFWPLVRPPQGPKLSHFFFFFAIRVAEHTLLGRKTMQISLIFISQIRMLKVRLSLYNSLISYCGQPQPHPQLVKCFFWNDNCLNVEYRICHTKTNTMHITYTCVHVRVLELEYG
jgi:hypothetical protein